MTAYKPVRIERPRYEVRQQPWGLETLLCETEAYTLKRLDYRSSMAGGLQMHTRKIETFTLVRGEAEVAFDTGEGKIEKFRMYHGDTVHVPAGAAHWFSAITDCIVYEASTPVKDDRVRLERYFGWGEPEGLPSTSPEPTRDESAPPTT